WHPSGAGQARAGGRQLPRARIALSVGHVHLPPGQGGLSRFRSRPLDARDRCDPDREPAQGRAATASGPDAQFLRDAALLVETHPGAGWRGAQLARVGPSTSSGELMFASSKLTVSVALGHADPQLLVDGEGLRPTGDKGTPLFQSGSANRVSTCRLSRTTMRSANRRAPSSPSLTMRSR